MWQRLKRLLLPYEFKDHPLHSPNPETEDLSDWDDLPDDFHPGGSGGGKNSWFLNQKKYGGTK